MVSSGSHLPRWEGVGRSGEKGSQEEEDLLYSPFGGDGNQEEKGKREERMGAGR